MDARSPSVVGLTSLPRQEGASIEWERTLDAPVDLGAELVGAPEGSPLKVRLISQPASEGMHIGGSVAAYVVGECVRCVRRFEYDVDEAIGELALYPEGRLALIEEGDEEAEEFPVIEDDHVDVEPVLRDAIVLSLPFTPLRELDCQGPCSGCGKRWEEPPDDHSHPLPMSDDGLLAVLEAKLHGDMEQRVIANLSNGGASTLDVPCSSSP